MPAVSGDGNGGRYDDDDDNDKEMDQFYTLYDDYMEEN